MNPSEVPQLLAQAASDEELNLIGGDFVSQVAVQRDEIGSNLVDALGLPAEVFPESFLFMQAESSTPINYFRAHLEIADATDEESVVEVDEVDELDEFFRRTDEHFNVE